MVKVTRSRSPFIEPLHNLQLTTVAVIPRVVGNSLLVIWKLNALVVVLNYYI